MKSVIFLGPTMPVTQARNLLDACYRPPAAMGDVFDAIEREKPDVVGIIDGYFDSVPSVWHKEILFALSRGIRVVGAASMGALRAAELCTFGMEGVGWVFEAFRSGALEDDDEVAVVHGHPEVGYVSLSTAMVNLRVGLQRAYERGIIEEATRVTLVDLAKRCFYPERSWDRLLQDGAATGIAKAELDGLKDFIDLERPDIKCEDASALLRQLAEGPARRPEETYPEPPITIFWDRLARSERKMGPTTSSVRAEELRRFTKATDSNFGNLQRAALLMYLAERECEREAVQPDQEGYEEAIREFRRRLDLISADSMKTWLDHAGLSSDDFHHLMLTEVRIASLTKTFSNQIDARLLEALALSGQMARTLERKARGEELNLAGRNSKVSRAELEAFYRSRIRRFSGSLQKHARDLGFSSASELIEQVSKVYEPYEH